jgi:hypothetical protein
MDRKTLSDADIASSRTVTRRTLLTALGLGAGLAAVATGAAATHAQSNPKPTRRDPCRDSDHGPPSDGDGCGKPPIS